VPLYPGLFNSLTVRQKPAVYPQLISRCMRKLMSDQYVKLLERAKRKWLQASTASETQPNPNLPDAIHVLLDLRRTAYGAVANSTETPFHSPGELNLSHLPAWAVQPLLGDLHSWFDLPAGVFQEGL
jgi:hypothetical protein